MCHLCREHCERCRVWRVHLCCAVLLCCDVSAGASKPVEDSLRDFGASLRWSAGVGLVLPTWFGRFEANYAWVLSSQELDRTKRGIQLGFVASAL